MTAVSFNQYMPLLPLATVAAAYGVRVHALSASGRSTATGRQFCYYAGLAVIAVGLVSPLDAAAEQSLIAHTSVHMLIGQIGAFLVVLGLTGPVLQPLLRIGWVGRLRVLSDPRPAFLLWVLNLFAWHTGVLFEVGLENDVVHIIQHGLFITLGINLWMPLVGPLPQPHWFDAGAKAVYVVFVFFTMMILGNVLVWSGEPFYESYAAGDGYWGLTPIEDQSVAGGIMMIVDAFFTIGLLAWLFMRWARESEEAQQTIEFARERGTVITPERGERAAAAGTTERLRRRIDGEKARSEAEKY
jgi:cytochrome c oxidase assembly factor CtaG